MGLALGLSSWPTSAHGLCAQEGTFDHSAGQNSTSGGGFPLTGSFRGAGSTVARRVVRQLRPQQWKDVKAAQGRNLLSFGLKISKGSLVVGCFAFSGLQLEPQYLYLDFY